MIRIATYLLLVFFITTSCKSKKTVSNSAEISSMSSKKIIKNHYQNDFDKETLSAKFRTNYQDAKTDINLTIKFRLEKDKVIWMSATKYSIPVAKIKITPTEVKFYEKIKKTYFDGDFTLLSDFLGTDIDFEKFQNLLLGQSMLNLKEQKYEASINKKAHLLKPKNNNTFFDVLFWVNPTSFKMDRQEVIHKEKQQKVSITYPEYQEKENQVIPKKTQIIAVDGKKVTKINLEYTSIEFNKKLTFPFTIPNGYKKIQLKN